MKNIRLVLLIAAVMFAGCKKVGKGEDEVSGSVSGEWHIISWAGDPAVQDVYVSFGEDGGFGLYQRVYTPYYEHFAGTYTVDGAKMQGKYDDGSPWAGNPYTISFSDGGNTLKMSRAASPGDVSVYVRASIPEDVLSGDLGLKSSDGGHRPGGCL